MTFKILSAALLGLGVLLAASPTAGAAKNDAMKLLRNPPSKICFTTSQGIEVHSTKKADCPDKVMVERATKFVLNYAHAQPDTFRGTQLVYVRGDITWRSLDVYGVSSFETNRAVVQLDAKAVWQSKLNAESVTRHELYHLALCSVGTPCGDVGLDWFGNRIRHDWRDIEEGNE